MTNNGLSSPLFILPPREYLLTLWQLDSNEFIASHKFKYSAGATLIADDFIVSTGRGRVVSQKMPLKPYQVNAEFTDLRWDNHMTVILA